MYLRSTRNLKSEVSLYLPVGMDKEGNEVMLIDLLGSTGEEISEDVELKEEQLYLWDKIKVLDQKEKYVLELRYGLRDGNRKTQREIAKSLGISRSYVSRIEKKAIQKLFKVMKK